jgi:hypothetical protein
MNIDIDQIRLQDKGTDIYRHAKKIVMSIVETTKDLDSEQKAFLWSSMFALSIDMLVVMDCPQEQIQKILDNKFNNE